MIAVTVCICTYKRAHIEKTLQSLLKQSVAENVTLNFVVVDNDSACSAKERVERILKQSNHDFYYEVEPEKNISLARNRAFANAKGDWVLFMDDDEVAEPDLIQTHLNCAAAHNAQMVIGTVKPNHPAQTPNWIIDGGFFSRFLPPAGTDINEGGTGNMFVNRKLAQHLSGPFDQAFGLTGGEDTDFCQRFKKCGHKIVSCPEAIATEEVEENRVNFAYLKKRAIRSGETYVHSVVAKLPQAKRVQIYGKSLVLLFAYSLLFLLLSPLSKARSVRWLLKAYSQYGKFRALFSLKKTEIYA